MTKKNIIIGILLALLLIAVTFFMISQPSNNRDWEIGFDVPANISIKDNEVSVKNVRNFGFENKKINSFKYLSKTYNAQDLETVWFVFEPFKIEPFTSFDGVAHTYFVFDFKNNEPVAVSVEARREKGETYDAFKGLFNKFELKYVWATEPDMTGGRVVVQNNKLYMYPLQISSEAKQKLFIEMAKRTQDLEKNPRFYNTLLSNCTNELAKAANKIKKNFLPPHIALIFPGYSISYLYDLKVIPTNTSLKELPSKYYISDLVGKFYGQKDFSRQIRENLPRKN